jgi:hypothetical protein
MPEWIGGDFDAEIFLANEVKQALASFTTAPGQTLKTGATAWRLVYRISALRVWNRPRCHPDPTLREKDLCSARVQWKRVLSIHGRDSLRGLPCAK